MNRRHGNGQCPVCHSAEIAGGFVEICDMEAVQEMDCAGCGAAWNEFYDFSARRDVRVDGSIVDVADIDPQTHGTLHVLNVDLGLLEEQRAALSRAVDHAAAGRTVHRGDIALLDGLRNLLDAWSDERVAPE